MTTMVTNYTKKSKTTTIRKILIFVLAIMITMALCCCGLDTSTVAGSASKVINNEDYDDSDDYSDNYEAFDFDLDDESEDMEDEIDEPMVWVSKTGKCYHSKSSCSNMNDPWQIPLSKALEEHKKACKKCY